MNQDQFAAMQPLLDKIAELAEKQFDSEELRRLVAELGGIVGKQKVASVTVIGRFKTSHRWALQNQPGEMGLFIVSRTGSPASVPC